MRASLCAPFRVVFSRVVHPIYLLTMRFNYYFPGGVFSFIFTCNEVLIYLFYNISGNRIEPRHEKKKLFMPYANNKGADQPAHPRSLISTFVVR